MDENEDIETTLHFFSLSLSPNNPLVDDVYTE